MTEWNKKRQTMRHYDYSAKVYDAQYSQEQDSKIKTALENLPLKKQSLILDAGCGTGLLFPYIAGTAKLIVGIDISAGILKEAKKKVKRHLKVALLRADVDHMPFPNHVFDIVFAVTLLQNVPVPHLTLYEMKRVNKNNALIVTTGLKKSFSRDAFAELLRKVGLKILVMKVDDQRKENIALCTKQCTR